MREDHTLKHNNDCPDELLMTTFIHGNCSQEQKADINAHILECDLCREWIEMNKEVNLEQHENVLSEVPEGIKDRAKALVDEKYGQNFLHLKAKFILNAFENIKTTGKIIMGPLSSAVNPLLRDESSNLMSNCLVKESFGLLDIQIELTRMEGDRNVIGVVVMDRANQKPVKDLRLTLLQDNEELESYVYHKQKVVFENVSPGTYIVELEQSNIILGAVRLELIGQKA